MKIDFPVLLSFHFSVTKMGPVVVLVFATTLTSTAISQRLDTVPSAGTLFSYDLNEPGPTINCIGYANLGGVLYQQGTRWAVTELGKATTAITVSTSTFMLSSDLTPYNTTLASNLTVLNVTSGLDGATITCYNQNTPNTASFVLKIYRPPVLKSVSTVTGLSNGSVTFQIGDTSSPPPYPAPSSFTITGNGTLSVAQLQYSHPNLTLSGLTEANSGSYVLTATNSRLNGGSIIGSSSGSFYLNILFPPVITPGPSLVAAVLGQPVTLVCGTNLRSNPSSTILWRDNNGTVLSTGGRYVFNSGPDIVYLNTSSTALSDNGTWTCILNNGVFSPRIMSMLMFILVPPSQPSNVTSNKVDFNHTQLYISWQAPSYPGVPPLSTYTVTATSPLDPNNRMMTVNTTSVLFSQLFPGLSYDISIVAVSIFGSVSASGPSSNIVTFSTVPTVPTLQCNSSMSTGGSVYLSWTVAYNGGRNVTLIQIEYILAASTQQYQPIDALVTPSTKSVLVREQFMIGRSYLFQIFANNSIGSSNVVCGPVLITEGIPLPPDQPIVSSTKQGTVTMTLSTAASGAGTTGTFVFIISSMPSVEMMPSTYSFPTYSDGQQVSVVINNIKDGVTYTFMVSASNIFGTSEFVNVTWVSKDNTPSGLSGAALGGVIGGVSSLLILIMIIVISLILCRSVCTPHIIKQKKTEPVELEENTAYGVVHKEANLIKLKNTEPVVLEENTAYGVVHKEANFIKQKKAEPAYAVVHTKEVVDVKENTAYEMIPRADKGKDDSAYEAVGGPKFREECETRT